MYVYMYIHVYLYIGVCVCVHAKSHHFVSASAMPGEFHGLYSLWGHKESDTTE